MTAKQPAVKKYVVALTVEERQQLTALIQTGKRPARQVLKARILLKADASDAGEGWSDSEIAEALDTSIDTVARTRQQLVEGGVDAALTRELSVVVRDAVQRHVSIHDVVRGHAAEQDEVIGGEQAARCRAQIGSADHEPRGAAVRRERTPQVAEFLLRPPRQQSRAMQSSQSTGRGVSQRGEYRQIHPRHEGESPGRISCCRRYDTKTCLDSPIDSYSLVIRPEVGP